MLLYILVGDLGRPQGLIAGPGVRVCCNGKCQGNKRNIGYMSNVGTRRRGRSARERKIDRDGSETTSDLHLVVGEVW